MRTFFGLFLRHSSFAWLGGDCGKSVSLGLVSILFFAYKTVACRRFARWDSLNAQFAMFNWQWKHNSRDAVIATRKITPLRRFAACVFLAPLVNTRFVWTASYAWTGFNARYDRVIIIRSSAWDAAIQTSLFLLFFLLSISIFYRHHIK